METNEILELFDEFVPIFEKNFGITNVQAMQLILNGIEIGGQLDLENADLVNTIDEH